MKITVEKFPQTRILYMSRRGAYGPENKVLMETFKQRIAHLNQNHVILAIAYDDPQQTAAHLCRYEVGVVNDKDAFMDAKILDEGTYLVFEIAHTEAAVEACWREIGLLLHEKKYELNTELPIIERYDLEKVNHHRCEICVPIC